MANNQLKLTSYFLFITINILKNHSHLCILALLATLPFNICLAEKQILHLDKEQNNKVLHIVGWDVYADPINKNKTIGYKEFEKKFNVIIHFIPLNNLDEIIYAVESNEIYDVVIISNEGIKTLNEMRLVEPLDLHQIPYFQTLYPSLKKNQWIEFNNTTYAVPWAWGPTGLLYDADLMPEPKSWNILWEPKFKGKISLWDDVSMIWITALALGYDNVYNLTRQQLSEVKKKLITLNDQIYQYYNGSEDAINNIRNNDVVILNSWFDPSARLRKEGRNLKMIIPEEGAVGMFDSFLISHQSNNINIAHDFINYQINPKTQRNMVRITGLAPANSSTKNILETDEIKSLHLNEADYFDRMLLWSVMPRKNLYDAVLKDVRADLQRKIKLSEELDLSLSEKNWLKLNPIVSFTGDPNWLPFEAFDKHGNYIGIVSEHLELIRQSTGIEFKMSPSKTWTESIEKIKQGKIDIISETDDSDLKSHLNFTTSYITNPIVIAMRNNEHYVESINHITNKKIALIKNYGYTSKIRKKYSNIKFISVDDIHNGLISVSTGEVDALLCTLALCSYTLSELGLNNVKIIGQTEFDTKLALGVQKKSPELLSILNKAISKITPEQQKIILDKWIKQQFITRTDYTLAIQITAVAVFLIVFFVFWNQRLKKEISLRIKIEDELHLFSMAMENSSEGLLISNSKNQITAINPAFSQITGYSFKEVKGKNPNILSSGQHDVLFYEEMWQKLINEGFWQGEIWDRRKNGEVYAKWITINTIYNDKREIIQYVALFSDITEKKQSEELIWKQANFDVLTGLPNRNMFYERLEQEILKSSRENLKLALLFIDLDQFKEINDTLGHDVGDKLLKEAACRISSCVRESDTVARLGGDEFTVIFPHVHEMSKLEDIINRMINKLSKQFQLDNEIVHISGSVGITLYPNDGLNSDVLIKNADQAMYAAKNRGRNCFSYFTQSMQDEAQQRMWLTNELRLALKNKQFEVYYQPIINLKTGRIYKAEALIRWMHPERGMISPMDFIPLSEDIGLINEIGEWVFKESLRCAKTWSSNYIADFQVSINMSPKQFKATESAITAANHHFMKEHNISGKNIVVEITEGLLLDANPDILNKILELRDLGIQVAIDDFGTGYSSLSYLNKFDIDYLKIDQSFTRNIEINKNDLSLSKAIIVMAHKLGLQIIAEGVETENQQNLLLESGCDFVQGYLYSKAIPAKEFELLLSSEQSN